MTNSRGPFDKDLLHELRILQARMERSGDEEAEAPSAAGQGLVVFRTYPQLDFATWNELVKAYGLHGWSALPLQDNLAPTLADLQSRLEELNQLTEKDPLTGLGNRRGMERMLDLEMERSQRTGLSMCLALLDIDDFKQINDGYGHECGDKVLTGLGRLLRQEIRKNDYAARYGGEEFVLLLPMTGLVQAQQTIHRVLQVSRGTPFQLPSAPEKISVTCSAGLVCYKGRRDLPGERLLHLADKAMYEAKALGKDTLVTAPLADLTSIEKEAQVRHHEKQFLLFGPEKE
jgi:diguanylate cyclase (GGDEF)-like protein